MSTTKPLFIPLKSEYFEAFESGEKQSELRRYGPRWNERTCVVGRPVILSKGYGKAKRIAGTVSSFEMRAGRDMPVRSWPSMMSIYGTVNVNIAVIGIKLTAPLSVDVVPLDADEVAG